MYVAVTCAFGTDIEAEEDVELLMVKSGLDQEYVGLLPCVPAIPDVRLAVAPWQASDAAGVIDAVQVTHELTSNEVVSDKLHPLSSVYVKVKL